MFFDGEAYLHKFQEAASDADKVFLAAIDKFDAMMSKSNVYTPDGTIICSFSVKCYFLC